MRDRQANYEVVEKTDDRLIIRDIGPHDKFMTVTNAAEEVVAELLSGGLLSEGQRLFYFDSSGDLDEIVVTEGRFSGFKPGPQRKAVTHG